ncbi:MAG: hypothetical protein E4H14_10940 [Candidatus Thorarchaeota archaeon]|nr:MAG: hypothetical protein E4H14_10940 [Candidatus Thorarchaeota archaeon]
MAENKLVDILKHMSDEKVRVTIYTIGGHTLYGYIVDFGEDYVRIRRNWKEDSSDGYVRIDTIDKVNTYWKKK